MKRAPELLCQAGALLGGICLVSIVVLVVFQVLARWLGLPAGGATELAGYAMANSFFLSMGYAFRQGAHIRITLCLDRLSDRSRRIVEVVVHGVGLGLSAYLTYFMTRMAYVSYTLGDISQGADATPLWMPQLGMALGSLLLTLAIGEKSALLLGGHIGAWRGRALTAVRAG